MFILQQCPSGVLPHNFRTNAIFHYFINYRSSVPLIILHWLTNPIYVLHLGYLKKNFQAHLLNTIFKDQIKFLECMELIINFIKAWTVETFCHSVWYFWMFSPEHWKRNDHKTMVVLLKPDKLFKLHLSLVYSQGKLQTGQVCFGKTGICCHQEIIAKWEITCLFSLILNKCKIA